MGFPALPLLFTFLFLFLTLITRWRRRNSGLKLPPSPWKLPFIGNIHQVFGRLPHQVAYYLIPKLGPLMLLKLGQVDLVVACSPEAAAEVLKTHDQNFSSRPDLLGVSVIGYGNSVIAFAPYGNYWRGLRKICALELLSSRRVKSFYPPWEQEISNLITYIAERTNSQINISEKLVALASTLTSIAAFGSKCRHEERFIDAVQNGLKLVSGFDLPDMFPSSSKLIARLIGLRPRMSEAFNRLDGVIDDIVNDHVAKEEMRKSRPQQEDHDREVDILDVLLELKEKGDLDFTLTMENIKAVILDIYTGGEETTSRVLTWTMAEIMRNPEVRKKVQAEVQKAFNGKSKIEANDMAQLHYLKLVIKETLRLHPPIPMLLPRRCAEPCQILGYDIPAGSRISVNAWAIGRDPRYWEDPLSFKPERFEGSSVDFKGGSFELLPFGGGRRICPGITYGFAVVELAIAQLLFNFDFELPKGMKPEDVDMTESFAGVVGMKTDIWVIAKPRSELLPAA